MRHWNEKYTRIRGTLNVAAHIMSINWALFKLWNISNMIWWKGHGYDFGQNSYSYWSIYNVSEMLSLESTTIYVSFVELKARYRAHNYLFCKQSFGHGFVFILKVEKKTSNLDLKWLWQNLRTVMLKMNELIKNQLKTNFYLFIKTM